MKKETVKISFNFRYSPDGTVYRKALSINDKILEAWRDSLACDLAMNKRRNYYNKLYLSQPMERANSVIFLNLTQAKHFIDWTKRIVDIEINYKRASYDANTCLIIK